MKIAIIGGGAAGYFAAINMKELNPSLEVTIFEATGQSLSKVKVSGGGRCNLTNTFLGISDLSRAYPRGDKLMKRVFKSFDNRDTIEWFERRGVKLTAQEDECIFPVSQSSQEIIDCFVDSAERLGVTVKHSHKVELIKPLSEGGYEISFLDAKLPALEFDRVVLTTGGSPKPEGMSMLKELSIEIVPPVPSLFSFNIPNNPITQLMGAVAESAEVSLVGSKLTASGALLITHWGMSGPAVLRLSSYGARLLNERDYKATISVNWIGERRTERVLEELRRTISQHGAKLVTSVNPFAIPSRLWMALLLKSGISHERRFVEIGSKGLNRLVNMITNDEYQLSGLTHFRDEFVTCGGVSLNSVKLSSCESKEHEGLYIAGELLDIDAITGGFNLQAAWSTAYIVAESASRK